MSFPRSVRLGVGVLACLAALGYVALPYVDAVALIARAASLPGTLGAIAAWRAVPVRVDAVHQVPTRHGSVDAQFYRPAVDSGRTVLLVPGVHMDGIRESRLVGLAEDLAASGLTVMTVATPDLQRFRITAATTDIIEDAARWLAGQTDGAAIGMLGISFSGGLSIVAAGRPPLRDRVAFVMSFGGHGDLPRVMRYLCSGHAPAMPDLADAARWARGADSVRVQPPHDYGVAVVLMNLADRIVPADQVEPLREGIRIFLLASSLTLVDMTRATTEFERARAFAAALPEPSRTLLTHVNDRAVDALGPVLLPVVERLGDDPALPALSPERAAPPAAPVYLLHGADDNVIPSVETVLLARHLHGRAEVHALLSGLITHAEVDRPPTAAEVWHLVRFWRSLMAR
ncbi:MAG: hypothetical protein AB1635_13425 [Acidobacteriota bacterium]